MHKIKQSEKLFALSAIAAGVLAWGSAHSIEYYNLTQMNPDGTPNTSLATTTPPINGAIFTSDVTQYPAGFGNIVGTGVIDPFLRIHRGDANCGNASAPCPEHGYNTTGNGSQPQDPEAFGTKEKEGHNWNHTLTLGSIGLVMKDGVAYRVFALDINEPKALGSKDDYLLSLDQFRLFASDNAYLEDYSCGVGLDCTSAAEHAGGASSYDPTQHNFIPPAGSSVQKIFDLDTSDLGQCPLSPTPDNPVGAVECDRTLALNSALTHGSGNGVDMVVYVPDALFDPSKPYIYLFSSFGELGINDTTKSGTNSPGANIPAGDFGQAGGFEEWYTLKKTPIVPTLALLIGGLAAMGGIRRLRPAPRFA